MTTPEDQTTTLGPPTDISVGPDDLETPAEDAPASTDAEQTAEDGEALGGTGGEDAGGAG